jgi:Clp amino terminal domain, pathogenicity island component/UvrB/uvrC motif
MFERFTDQARRVVAIAQEEARMLNRTRTGTEHLLLGLVHERDGVAAVALDSLGISPEAVRRQVEEISGQGQEAPATHPQYTLRAKKVLDLSRREALHLGHNHIGTEHILLGLIREGEGPAVQVLVELGADPGLVRQQVTQLVHDGYDEGEAQAGPAAAAPRAAPPAPRPGPVAGPDSRLLGEILARIEDMDSRLSAVEQRMGPGPDMRDLDRQITQARRDKESAVGTEDYEGAAALRDKERQLLADKAACHEEWIAAHLDLPSLAEGFQRLSDEVGRLRGLLRQKGIEPRDGAA